MSVPGPDDIFRPTAVPAQPVVELKSAERADQDEKGARSSSGRVKHDEKMTVYVTTDELIDVEHARLELRRHHGLAVDRGRIVRAAVALALEELDEHGAESQLVRRLSQQ